MQLAFDADVEAFRDEFIAFLDEHLPDEAETGPSGRSRRRTSPSGRGAGSG